MSDPVTAVPSKPFADLGFFQKLQFIGKVIVFLATFGFAFPTLFAD